MGVRTAVARIRSSARLAVIGCGALTVLAVTTACTGTGGTSASGTPLATPSGSFFTALAPGASASASASASPSPSASPATEPATTPVVIGSPSPTTSPSSSPVPIGAPSTGGGGTAGVQDILLFGLGGAALLAGAGSLAYRRRVTRDR